MQVWYWPEGAAQPELLVIPEANPVFIESVDIATIRYGTVAPYYVFNEDIGALESDGAEHPEMGERVYGYPPHEYIKQESPCAFFLCPGTAVALAMATITIYLLTGFEPNDDLALWLFFLGFSAITGSCGLYGAYKLLEPLARSCMGFFSQAVEADGIAPAPIENGARAPSLPAENPRPRSATI